MALTKLFRWALILSHYSEVMDGMGGGQERVGGREVKNKTEGTVQSKYCHWGSQDGRQRGQFALGLEYVGRVTDSCFAPDPQIRITVVGKPNTSIPN